MIKINLLPQGDRVAPPTSFARLAVIGASGLLGLISFVFFAVIHFKSLREAESNLLAAETTRKQLEGKKINENHDEIKKILSSFEIREKAIEQIQLMRTDMSRKMYEFSRLFENHPVWIKDLTISPEKKVATPQARGAKPAAPVLEMPKFAWLANAQSAGSELEKAIAFYRSLTEDKIFFRDFLKADVPLYSKIKMPEGYTEETGFSFQVGLSMQMRPDDDKKTPEKTDNKDGTGKTR